ncbi:DUF411 domain-containing protein [Afipia birgiae]|jgi:hypothetical protein|uniref:DUF411 domain-containing protein n=1 Tax=Afipia birgiae TaxID=151414 RepID=UPI0002F15523|nr:DUF411 domain-containing protein [Afipia birgiae]
MQRRTFCVGLISILAATPIRAADAPRAVLYKNPQCSCCEGYAAYLRRNGFIVDVKATNDLSEISRKAGVPDNLQGCHTMFIEGYVVDGHVPISIVRKMLSERPAIAGITLPGMPEGSPGMTGRKSGAFTVYAVFKDSSQPKIYAVE